MSLQRARSGLAALVLPLLLAPAAWGAEGPVPLSLRIDVQWGQEKNRDSYREDLRSLLVQDFIARNCFASIVTEPPSDLTLRVTLDLLDIAEEREFVGAPTGGSGEIYTRSVTVTIAGQIDLVTPGGLAVRDSRHFRRVETADPRSPTDEPMSRAVLQALNEPVRWAQRLACTKPERLVEEAEKAGVTVPATKR